MGWVELGWVAGGVGFAVWCWVGLGWVTSRETILCNFSYILAFSSHPLFFSILLWCPVDHFLPSFTLCRGSYRSSLPHNFWGAERPPKHLVLFIPEEGFGPRPYAGTPQLCCYLLHLRASPVRGGQLGAPGAAEGLGTRNSGSREPQNRAEEGFGRPDGGAPGTSKTVFCSSESACQGYSALNLAQAGGKDRGRK